MLRQDVESCKDCYRNVAFVLAFLKALRVTPIAFVLAFARCVLAFTRRVQQAARVAEMLFFCSRSPSLKLLATVCCICTYVEFCCVCLGKLKSMRFDFLANALNAMQCSEQYKTSMLTFSKLKSAKFAIEIAVVPA